MREYRIGSMSRPSLWQGRVAQKLWLWLMALVLPLGTASAQMVKDAVSWDMQQERAGDKEYVLVFSAKMKSGWHIYDTTMPEGGPESTSIMIDKISGGELVGKLTADRKPTEEYDKAFDMKLRYFSGEVKIRQRVRVSGSAPLTIEGAVRYMACDNEMCLPPTNWDFSVRLEGSKADAGQGVQVAPPATPEQTNELGAEPAPSEPSVEEPDMAPTAEVEGPVAAQVEGSVDLWTPVVEELRSFGDKTFEQATSSLPMIFIYGFLGGLLALLTPCVWPMIPMTVSFFLKRSKERSRAIGDALLYGLAIIVIYLVLGLVITGIFGASALNDLATNATFNIAFFLLLVFFAISFFGAFELVLPASWTSKIDAKADSTTGVLSIAFMAFTLALVSFSCTGPIIGTLLVQAASSGELMGPAIGMLGFALALALPFSLFAIFPSFLQAMPKSGGWLNVVKVVLAFLELALSLKFLSVADLAYQWGILDRETFLVLWIVIFTLLGFYLLGKLRFSHDSPTETTSIPRLFLSIISFAFALYMVPGLWGAPLRAISAFAPPSTTQDFSLYEGGVHAKYDDYEAGMEYAKRVGKPVLIDFSGYGCVNCRKMEASVWINPEVKSILEKDYVLITLMVDDKTALPQIIEVEEQGKKVKLRTIGDKWSYLQRVKFGANAQPFYVALDHEGKPLTPSRGYNEDVEEYIDFLRGGLAVYGERK